jgi:hypothetical protein
VGLDESVARDEDSLAVAPEWRAGARELMVRTYYVIRGGLEGLVCR